VSDLILDGRDWNIGHPALELGTADAEDAVRWVHLHHEADAKEAQTELVELFGQDVPTTAVRELLTPDPVPAIRDHEDDSELRCVSSFGLRVRDVAHEHEQSENSAAGVVVFEPVKFLAAERWLASCSHPQRTHRGASPQPLSTAEPEFRIGVDAIDRMWMERGLQTSGDLGVLMLADLAVSYRPAQHALYAWLEQWELDFWAGHPDGDRTLRDIWGSVVLMRAWLNPLNRPGLRRDISRAWFRNATSYEEVLALDDRVDKTLAGLRTLGESLRASFSVEQLRLAEQQREAAQRQQQSSERLNRTLGFATAALAGPTIITAVIGARTNFPLGDGSSAFFITLALTLVSVAAVAAGIYFAFIRRS